MHERSAVFQVHAVDPFDHLVHRVRVVLVNQIGDTILQRLISVDEGIPPVKCILIADIRIEGFVPVKLAVGKAAVVTDKI